MPHYVAAEKVDDTKFVIFSTAIMGEITPEMTLAEMKEYLKEHGYESWLDPRSWNEQEDALGSWNPEGEDATQLWAHESIREASDKYTYWNGHFWYVTYRDGYFVSY